jgi:hypothetical protein
MPPNEISTSQPHASLQRERDMVAEGWTATTDRLGNSQDFELPVNSCPEQKWAVDSGA